MKSFLSICVFVFCLVSASAVVAESKLGVVLMHGKTGTARETSPIGYLKEYLVGEGILVLAPDMPWHRERYLDKSYEDSMLEIDQAVEELKSRGATRIVVGGHSMGANAAIGYGARREGLAGILAIAAGHPPDDKGFQAGLVFDWKRAKKMVDSGRGGESAAFLDANQGEYFEINVPAALYLSWFQPGGPASMPTNVKNLKPNTPLLWILGEEDKIVKWGEDYAFSGAPEHPKNAYIVVGGGHRETPDTGRHEILEWLNSL